LKPLKRAGPRGGGGLQIHRGRRGKPHKFAKIKKSLSTRGMSQKEEKVPLKPFKEEKEG
jgi:hypothetical protein